MARGSGLPTLAKSGEKKTLKQKGKRSPGTGGHNDLLSLVLDDGDQQHQLNNDREKRHSQAMHHKHGDPEASSHRSEHQESPTKHIAETSSSGAIPCWRGKGTRHVRQKAKEEIWQPCKTKVDPEILNNIDGNDTRQTAAPHKEKNMKRRIKKRRRKKVKLPVDIDNQQPAALMLSPVRHRYDDIESVANEFDAKKAHDHLVLEELSRPRERKLRTLNKKSEDLVQSITRCNADLKRELKELAEFNEIIKHKQQLQDKELLARAVQSTTMLQRCWRGKNGRARWHLLYRDRCISRIQHFLRTQLMRIWYTYYLAARRVQKHVRGRQAAARVSLIREEASRKLRKQASTKIQRRGRAYVRRKEKLEKHEAALKIQAMVRKVHWRLLYREIVKAREAAILTQMAIKLQAQFKTFLRDKPEEKPSNNKATKGMSSRSVRNVISTNDTKPGQASSRRNVTRSTKEKVTATKPVTASSKTAPIKKRRNSTPTVTAAASGTKTKTGPTKTSTTESMKERRIAKPPAIAANNKRNARQGVPIPKSSKPNTNVLESSKQVTDSASSKRQLKKPPPRNATASTSLNSKGQVQTKQHEKTIVPPVEIVPTIVPDEKKPVNTAELLPTHASPPASAGDYGLHLDDMIDLPPSVDMQDGLDSRVDSNSSNSLDDEDDDDSKRLVSPVNFAKAEDTHTVAKTTTAAATFLTDFGGDVDISEPIDGEVGMKLGGEVRESPSNYNNTNNNNKKHIEAKEKGKAVKEEEEKYDNDIEEYGDDDFDDFEEDDEDEDHSAIAGNPLSPMSQFRHDSFVGMR